MTTVSVARPGRAAERRFYAGMAWAILATVLLGFGRSYFLRPLFPALHPITPPESFFYFVHGVLFTAWIVLLAVQPALIATRRVALHRRLGWVGTGLAAAMVVAGIEGALMAGRRPAGFMGIPVPAAQFVVVPLFDMVLFALFVTLAVVRRRDAQAHKRFMLVATINLMAAAVARIPLGLPPNPLIFFGGQDLFFVPLVVWDLWTRRRIHPATLFGVLLTIASQPLRLMLSGTEAWARLAAWLLG